MPGRRGVARAVAALTLAATVAAGQVPARSGVPTPGKGVATVADSDAVVVNPAGLALVPGTELRLQWAGGGERPDQGLALGASTPLVFGLSAAARADVVRPASGPDRTWASGALSYAWSEHSAIGLSFGRSYADDRSFNHQWSLTAGAVWRPFSWLGGGLVARNLDAPRNGHGATLQRSLEAGLVVRPTGRRGLEIGLDALRFDDPDAISPRVTAAVVVPGLGRVRGEVTVDRSGGGHATTGMLGLELGVGHWSVAGGGWAGSQPGYFGGVALRDYRDDAIQDRHVVRIRLEATPGDRAHVRLLRMLWQLADAPEVAGVVLQLKAEPASSGAHAEELGDAIRKLRSRGKKVLCHLDDRGGRSLHVCSQADRTLVLPVGGVRYAGAQGQYIYLGGLLQKLGVKAEFVRIAEHKTAPEQFTERGPTPAAEADHRETLTQFEATFLHDVGGGRRISVPELRERLARGPFSAEEARAAGLVDGVANDDELGLAMGELVGERLPMLPPEASPALERRPADVMGHRDHVAVIYIDGDMVDGRSRSVPLVGNRLVGSYTVAAALQQARADDRVRAVVVRLETPGGSSTAAEALWREVYLTARVKPVIASMGSTAASAGYYVASAAGQIFASRTTLTGSIGIYYGKADVSALLNLLGLNVVTYRTAPRADADSLFRPFTDDERTAIGERIKRHYDVFVDRVSRGRKMSPDAVDAVARGKVWTGEQAHARHLVDRLGGLREALDEARRLGHLAPDSPVVELPAQPTDLLSTALSLAGLAQSAEPTPPVPPDVLRALRRLVPLTVYDADTPIARLDDLPEMP